MDISIFDYHLPNELIAQDPAKERDLSRLLVYIRKDDKIVHCKFRDIVEYLSPGDCIVINKTKVIPAKINCKKLTGGRVELLALKQLDTDYYTALCRDNILHKELIFPDNTIKAKVVNKTSAGEYILQFDNKIDMNRLLNTYGQVPLPPYIKRKVLKTYDKERYQTVYAEYEGSIAAPTAGLHFTTELLNKLENKGVIIAELILHIGWGTFKPVVANNIEEHHMLEEYYELHESETEKINYAKGVGKKVVAVGTSIVRALETLYNGHGGVNPGKGETALFIYPGYNFRIIDSLITNFHLPKSTPFILVCAFSGRENTMNMYQKAIQLQYRFYSYGDAMLIL